MTKLGVFGSRSLSGKQVSALLIEEIEAHGVDHLVTAGEPEGVCEAARSLARQLGMTLTLHHYPRDKGRGMYYWRSEYTLDASDRVVLVHDGTSQGTANELRQAQARHMPYTYHLLVKDAPPRAADLLPGAQTIEVLRRGRPNASKRRRRPARGLTHR